MNIFDENTPDGVYTNDNGTRVEIATEAMGSFCLVQNLEHWKICTKRELPEAITWVEDLVTKSVLEELKGGEITDE